MRGIYCYIDKESNKIIYVGKDSHIDKDKRHKRHFQPSLYDAQPINRILQNNSDRYSYEILVFNIETEETLNALEIQYIRQLQPRFNFTDGGDGVSGFKHSNESKKKISEATQKTWKSEEYRKKHNKGMKKVWKLEKYRKKQSKIRESEEYRKKLSEAQRRRWGSEELRIIKYGFKNGKQIYAIKHNTKIIKRSFDKKKLKKELKKIKKEISFNDLSKSLKQDYMNFQNSINDN